MTFVWAILCFNILYRTSEPAVNLVSLLLIKIKYAWYTSNCPNIDNVHSVSCLWSVVRIIMIGNNEILIGHALKNWVLIISLKSQFLWRKMGPLSFRIWPWLVVGPEWKRHLVRGFKRKRDTNWNWEPLLQIVLYQGHKSIGKGVRKQSMTLVKRGNQVFGTWHFLDQVISSSP